MATYSPSAPDANAIQPNYEDEVIDIRKLFSVLLRWWREIILITTVALLLGGGIVVYLRTWAKNHPSYEAAAQVTVARVFSDVSIDETFRTELNDVSSPQDVGPRRTALLGLVYNGAIAQRVVEELGPMLPGWTPSHLLGQVSATYVGEGVSDLIEIQVTADTPQKAAAIANAWATHYVEHINALYGEIPPDIAERVEVELVKAQATYDETQRAYEEFLITNDLQTVSRQIEEKQKLIAVLRSSRQTGLENIINQTMGYQQQVIATYLEAVQQNRLLAFSKEQEANRQMVSQLIETISANRRTAFAKDQEARVKLFNQYADLELQNRLLALSQEQNAKAQIFQAYNEADLKAKLAVFNEQVEGNVSRLVGDYETKRRLERLLDEARALQQQIDQSGDAGAMSNSLPILLLKIEAYAATASGAQPLDFQFNLDSTQSLEISPANQLTDLAVLVETVEARIAELETRISEQSQALYNNEDLQLQDGVRPEDDALYAAIQEQYLALFDIGELAHAEEGSVDGSALSQAITAKYDELFALGPLASASLVLSDTAPLYLALETQYPELFAVGDLTYLSDSLFNGSPLDAESQEQINEMLEPLDILQGYLETAESSEQPIFELEEELKQLQALQENQNAQRQTLLQQRDMALESYTTLNTKLLELTLQRTATNREVRLASPANPPDRPEPGISLLWAGVSGVLGFFLALTIVLLANFLDVEPLLSRRRPHFHHATAGQGG